MKRELTESVKTVEPYEVSFILLPVENRQIEGKKRQLEGKIIHFPCLEVDFSLYFFLTLLLFYMFQMGKNKLIFS